jgi:hypothetical protein
MIKAVFEMSENSKGIMGASPHTPFRFALRLSEEA